MMQVLRLLLGALLALSPALAAAQTVEVLRDNGPPQNRIDVVVLGDGYRAADQGLLTQHANELVTALFSATPWSEYQALFNVKLVHVVSAENGADRGTFGELRDTALDATFFCAGTERALCVDNGKAYAAASMAAPELDVVMVIVNDPKYGGSGGQVPVTSIHAQSKDILRHELGHSVSGLADEYETPYPGYPACSSVSDCPEPNATIRSTREAVKWSTWIPQDYPVPTPKTAAFTDIGVFEGARYKSTGVYRPKHEGCMMRTLGLTFCSVCAEGIVRSFWSRASPIESTTPAAGSLPAVCGEAQLSFAFEPVPVTGTSFSTLWTLNGTPLPSTAETLSLDATLLQEGMNALAVSVEDQTPLVRNDPGGVLKESRNWTLSYVRCATGDCDQSATCTADGGCVRVPQPVDVACGTQSCAEGALSGVGRCDGSGGCILDAPVSCAPYACTADGTGCLAACAQRSDCQGDFVCFEGKCVTQAEARYIYPKADSTFENSASGCGCTASASATLPFLLVLAASALKRRKAASR